MISKKITDLLNQAYSTMRLNLPDELNEMIEARQEAEKNRFNKKNTKHTLVVEMMQIGCTSFCKLTEQYKKEFENYNI